MAATFHLEDLFADLQIHYVPVSELVPSKTNPRVRLKDDDPDGFNGLSQSLGKGVFKPMIVEKPTKEIIDGRQSLDAAVSKGATHVAVLYLRKLTKAEKTRARIELNHHRGHDLISMLWEQTMSLPEDDMKLILSIPSVATLISPLPPTKADADQKFTTFKVPRMPLDASERAHAILAAVMKRNTCKEAAALLYVLELHAQDPQLSETG